MALIFPRNAPSPVFRVRWEGSPWPLAFLVALFLLGGMGNSIASVPSGYEVVTPGTLKPGDDLPPAHGRIILRVYGSTLPAAKGRPLHFDRAGLESMGTIRYSSKNRWYDHPTTYEGVLGSRFLEIVGVPKGASIMRMRALNDYVVRIPIPDFRKWPVMLALKLNGKYMTVREKGPIWVVYPNHIAPKLGELPYSSRWIWQLTEIVFE